MMITEIITTVTIMIILRVLNDIEKCSEAKRADYPMDPTNIYLFIMIFVQNVRLLCNYHNNRDDQDGNAPSLCTS